MIENHIVGEPLPTCFPCMFSKKNDAVVVALIQNLGATPLMDFFRKSDLSTEPVCCRMKCHQCACHTSCTCHHKEHYGVRQNSLVDGEFHRIISALKLTGIVSSKTFPEDKDHDV